MTCRDRHRRSAARARSATYQAFAKLRARSTAFVAATPPSIRGERRGDADTTSGDHQ
jgi:hypothetical protein